MTAVGIVSAFGSASLRELLAAGRERGLSFVCLAEPADPPEAVTAAEALGEVLRSADGGGAEAAVLLRERSVQAVLTFCDAGLATAAELCAALGLPGIAPSAACRVRSKHLQRAALNAAGVGAVAIAPIPDPSLAPPPSAIPYPAVLKPEDGAGGAATMRVDSHAELLRALSGVGERPMVLEAMVAPSAHPAGEWLADYVSVDSVVASGAISHFGVVDRLPPAAPFRETGAVFPSLLPAAHQRAILAVVEDAVRALELDHAVLHTELRLNEESAIVIEVNARLGGYMNAGWTRAGAGSPLGAAFDVALGLDPTPPGVATRPVLLHNVHAPMGARRLIGAPTAAQLRRLPGVWSAECFRGAGDDLDWRRGWYGRICDVWLEAEDAVELRERYEALTAVLAEALTFEA
ncbi:MAG TPA: ATP-grasp domain-containing protein [Solirubrobacterales bacterium]|nr:ATP-grasp domain-containing protein [Solirubrobacterales bacterium]